MRGRILDVAFLVAAVTATVGCSGEDGTTHQGEVGGHCYPNGTCNVGLNCSAGICVPIDAAPPDAPLDAPMDAPLDASTCNNDSAFEPNETIATAYVSGVANTTLSRVFASLAICPGDDKDTFAITIATANQNLEAVIDYQAGGAPIGASILNAGGVPIANASPVSGMPQRMRAYTPNLPVGTYYAQIYAASPPSINNYQLTLNVTGP
ncbi:MAG TPA: hypothetical protein VLB44_16020 [Kofleriaceae bacterium]|nr:hypothetical protein [Kofleriaceae bacterium]